MAADLSKLEPEQLHLYHQYRNTPLFEDLFNVVRDYIKTRYFGLVDEFIKESNPYTAEYCEFMRFFYENYFGGSPILGASGNSFFYDNNEFWDGEDSYDESDVYSGEVEFEQFLHVVRFILDYSYQVWNIDTLVTFIARCRGIAKNKIGIDLTTWNTIKLSIPGSLGASDFVNMMRQYRTLFGLPLGVNIGIQLAAVDVEDDIVVPKRAAKAKTDDSGFSR